ncbi:MAG: hypothetical protein V1859_11235 [archaeon]
MEENHIKFPLFYLGLIIFALSIMAAFVKINNWYFPAVIGALLLFDSVSGKKNSTISIFCNNKFRFLKLYLLLFSAGISIESIGRLILHLWAYPHISSIFHEFMLFLFYPFILMSFREMFESILMYTQKKAMSFIASMILGIIIWEIPNLFAKDWIYLLPIDISFFNLNVIVILGWSMLIGIPLFIYKEYI